MIHLARCVQFRAGYELELHSQSFSDSDILAALILGEYPGGDTMMTPRKFPRLASSEPSPAEFRKYTVWQSQLHDSQLPAASCVWPAQLQAAAVARPIHKE